MAKKTQTKKKRCPKGHKRLYVIRKGKKVKRGCKKAAPKKAKPTTVCPKKGYFHGPRGGYYTLDDKGTKQWCTRAYYGNKLVIANVPAGHSLVAIKNNETPPTNTIPVIQNDVNPGNRVIVQPEIQSLIPPVVETNDANGNRKLSQLDIINNFAYKVRNEDATWDKIREVFAPIYSKIETDSESEDPEKKTRAFALYGLSENVIPYGINFVSNEEYQPNLRMAYNLHSGGGGYFPNEFFIDVNVKELSEATKTSKYAKLNSVSWDDIYRPYIYRTILFRIELEKEYHKNPAAFWKKYCFGDNCDPKKR